MIQRGTDRRRRGFGEEGLWTPEQAAAVFGAHFAPEQFQGLPEGAMVRQTGTREDGVPLLEIVPPPAPPEPQRQFGVTTPEGVIPLPGVETEAGARALIRQGGGQAALLQGQQRIAGTRPAPSLPDLARPGAAFIQAAQAIDLGTVVRAINTLLPDVVGLPEDLDIETEADAVRAALTRLEVLVGDDPERVLDILKAKGRTLDTEVLLTAFGATPEEINRFYEGIPFKADLGALDWLIPAVFQGRHGNIGETIDWVQENQETFLSELRGMGHTPETDALLKTMGNTDRQIAYLYGEIPPEGFQIEVLIDREGVPTTIPATVRPDGSVWMEDEQVGTWDAATGQLVPTPLPWWKQYLAAPALKALDFVTFALLKFPAMGVWMGFGAASEVVTLGKSDFWEKLHEQRQELPQTPLSVTDLGDLWQAFEDTKKYYEGMFGGMPNLQWHTDWEKPAILGGGELTFGAKGLTEGILSLPLWLAIPTATGLRATLLASGKGILPSTPAMATYAALAPIAGLEVAIATGLRYGIGLPAKFITVDLPKRVVRESFETALDKGLARWLAVQGSRGDQANRVVAYFLRKNQAWLHRRAQQHIIDALARKRGASAAEVGRTAAEATLRDAEPLMLAAAREASIEGAAVGATEETTRALAAIALKVARGGEKPTVDSLVALLPAGAKPLQKTQSLMLQLRDKGVPVEEIEAMTPREAWVRLFEEMPLEPVAAAGPPVDRIQPNLEGINQIVQGLEGVEGVTAEIRSTLEASQKAITEAAKPDMTVGQREAAGNALQEVTGRLMKLGAEASEAGNSELAATLEEARGFVARTGTVVEPSLAELEGAKVAPTAEVPVPTPEAVEPEVVPGVPTVPTVPAEVTLPPGPTVEELAKKPAKAKSDVTPAEVAEHLQTTGQPDMTVAEAESALSLFGAYIDTPTTTSAWELTQELRRETRAGRAKLLKARTQELIIEEGISPEQAINQAIKETMSGELPSARSDFFDDLTQRMRDAFFSKVYLTLKEEPFEMMSTASALTNALMGNPIPRDPGIRGGSAYTRLQRVFSPGVFEAVKKIAASRKPLRFVIEATYEEIGKAPIPVDEKMAAYLRGLPNVPYGRVRLGEEGFTPTGLQEKHTAEEMAQGTLELRLELAKGPQAVTDFEVPVEDGAKQIPLLPRPAMEGIILVLKEIGWSPVDIGNFLRANKASFDFSFWRQQAPLIAGHPISFVQANVEAWKAIWSRKSAEASWERITRDPLFEVYELAAEQGGDFLRPLILQKGTAQWRGTEEFGYLTGARVIPRLTAKLPWVKLSARAFETGTNVHNWLIYKNYYKAMLKLNEMYASGQKTLKPGEAFDIQKEMIDFAKSLSNFTARGSLGKFTAAAPTLSGFFFAPRAAIGRILSVKDLINANPRVRLEAWKNASTFVSTFGGIILLGAAAGWWSVERDPKSAEYMSIRIGSTRIDPWGGFRQFLVFFTRAITQTGVSSVTGAEYKADPINLLQTFIRGKASPLASLILDFWRGKNFIGEEVDVKNKKQWAERVAPFSVWDIYEAYMDDPLIASVSVIPAMLGAGVQTYTGDWAENVLKLGLPKYSDNLTYGLTEPRYDTADFWADTSGQFTGVDPATLTPEKGFPNYIRALVEAKIIKESLSIIPNEKLIRLNADPDKGTTFAQYYRMWRDREKIVASGDEKKLAEFDKDERTRNAHLGNFSQRQFALLNEYWSITDKKKQTEFLELHVAEIGTNMRDAYLRSHPKENAQLAVWGQAQILTLEAYNEVERLLNELDIPDAAIPETLLPPKESIETHFAYIEEGEEGGYGTWETQLIIAKDDAYREWKGLQTVDTPIAALELLIADRALYDEEKLLRDTLPSVEDRDAANYEDGYQFAIEQLKEKNPVWVDNQRRVEALKQGVEDNPTPDTIVESWVERGRKVDEFTAGAGETKVWLVDNMETYQWALDNELLTDDGGLPEEERSGQHEPWNTPKMRVEIEWRDKDEEYDAIKHDDASEQARLRTEFLDLPENEKYAVARRQIEFYEIDLEPDDERLGLLDSFVDYKMIPQKGKRGERYLMNDRDLYDLLLDAEVMDNPISAIDFSEDVPNERFDDIYDDFPDAFDRYYDADGIAEEVRLLTGKAREDKRDDLRTELFFANPGFERARLEREGWERFVGDLSQYATEEWVSKYADYYGLPAAGMDQELYLKKNPGLAAALGLEKITKHVESLRISVKYAQQDTLRDSYGDVDSPNYIPDETKRALKRKEQFRANRTYAVDWYKRFAYDKNFPGALVSQFAEFRMVEFDRPEGWKKYWADDRYLLTHPQLFTTAKRLLKWDRKAPEPDKVATERFERAWNEEYDTLRFANGKANAAARKAFRRKNPWFDGEGQRVLGWKPITSQRAQIGQLAGRFAR